MYACVYMFEGMYVCMHTGFIRFACGGQRKELAPLELHLGIVELACGCSKWIQTVSVRDSSAISLAFAL